MGFPGGSDSKESACSAGDMGLIPGSGRSPGEGNGYPLQYSCLENPMDRGVWCATVHGHLLVSEQAESQALVPVTRRQVVSAGLQLPKLHSSGALGKHRRVQLPELTHQKASGSPQVLGFLRWPQTTQCFSDQPHARAACHGLLLGPALPHLLQDAVWA